MVSEGYSSDGLREIANCIDEFLINTDLSQNELARKVGVSSATIGTLRKNARSLPGQIIAEPSIKTLSALAPHLPDPLTGKPFAPERLRRIAFGEESLKPQKKQLSPIEEIAIQFQKNPSSFLSNGLSEVDIDSMLRGEKLTVRQMLQLAKATNKSPLDIFTLFGIDVSKPL